MLEGGGECEGLGGAGGGGTLEAGGAGVDLDDAGGGGTLGDVAEG